MYTGLEYLPSVEFSQGLLRTKVVCAGNLIRNLFVMRIASMAPTRMNVKQADNPCSLQGAIGIFAT